MFHISVLFILILVLLYYFLELKTRNIIKLLIIGIFIIWWIPYAIEYFFDDNISPKKIYEKENIKFWIDYIGTIIGGVITLFGIWWQVTRQEKQKEKDEKIGLLKALHYHLEKNKDLEKKKYNILIPLYFTGNIFLRENSVEAIHSFNDLDLRKNQLKIMSLDYGKELLDIDFKILSFNREYIFLCKSSKYRKRLIEKLKENDNGSIKEIIEILEDLSEIIFYYTYYNFDEKNIEMIKCYKKNLIWKIKAFKNNEELKKYIIKMLEVLKNEEKYDFFSQNKEVMLILSSFLKEGIELLYNFVFIEENVTEEEEAELFKYYTSISKIVSINIFDLSYTMQKIDKKIIEELEILN